MNKLFKYLFIGTLILTGCSNNIETVQNANTESSISVKEKEVKENHKVDVEEHIKKLNESSEKLIDFIKKVNEEDKIKAEEQKHQEEPEPEYINITHEYGPDYASYPLNTYDVELNIGNNYISRKDLIESSSDMQNYTVKVNDVIYPLVDVDENNGQTEVDKGGNNWINWSYIATGFRKSTYDNSSLYLTAHTNPVGHLIWDADYVDYKDDDGNVRRYYRYYESDKFVSGGENVSIEQDAMTFGIWGDALIFQTCLGMNDSVATYTVFIPQNYK